MSSQLTICDDALLQTHLLQSKLYFWVSAISQFLDDYSSSHHMIKQMAMDLLMGQLGHLFLKIHAITQPYIHHATLHHAT